MAVGYKMPRGTRSALNAKASGGTIVVGQPYLITDENRIAVGLTTTTYATYRLETEGALSVFCSGKPANGEVIGGGVAPYAVTLNASNCSAIAGVAFTSSAVFSIKKNGSEIGTITFSASGTAGAFSFSNTSVAKGDRLTVVAPSTADSTGADLTILIAS